MTVGFVDFPCLWRLVRWARTRRHPHGNQARHSQNKCSYVIGTCGSWQTGIPWQGCSDTFPHPEIPLYAALIQRYLLSFHLMCEIKCPCWRQENAQSHRSIAFLPDPKRAKYNPRWLCEKIPGLWIGQHPLNVPDKLQMALLKHCWAVWSLEQSSKKPYVKFLSMKISFT